MKQEYEKPEAKIGRIKIYYFGITENKLILNI